MTTLYDFTPDLLDETPQPLSAYQGKVVLVVNTASKCGLTPQFEGLEQLWEKYADRGLVVLGFPCNQFKEQEPGSAAEIGEFCQRNYGVSFPMFAKIEVNGDGADPLYTWLRSAAAGTEPGPDIEWNFAKFLIGRDGTVIERFGSRTEPSELDAPIQQALAG